MSVTQLTQNREPRRKSPATWYTLKIKKKPRNLRYGQKISGGMASLERPRSEVVTEIVNYARQRDPESKTPLIVVMDGALALWTLIAGVLKDVEYTGVFRYYPCR